MSSDPKPHRKEGRKLRLGSTKEIDSSRAPKRPRPRLQRNSQTTGGVRRLGVSTLPGACIGLLLFYGCLGNLIAWIDRQQSLPDAALLLVRCALALKLRLGALAFQATLKRHLVTRGFVLTSVGVWVIRTAICVKVVSLLAEQAHSNEPMLLPIAGLLFPLVRIALAHLALELNRHRSI